jgi:PAS domain S-box-containing protein
VIVEDHERHSRSGTAPTESIESRERLKYLIDSSPSVIYACKPSGDFPATFMGEKVTELLGYEPVEFIENTALWAECIHPDDRERVFNDLSALFEKGHHVHEYRFRHKNGSYCWMRDELKLVHDTEGNPLEIVGSWTDISESREMEGKLRVAESRLRSVLKTSPAIIFSGQFGGATTFVSENVSKHLGYEVREFLDDPDLWKRHIHPDDVEGVLEGQKTLLEKGSVSFEHRYRHKNGGYRWMLEQAVLMRDMDGNPTEIVGSWVDITERRAVEEALRQSEERYRSFVQNFPGIAFRGRLDFTPVFFHGAVEDITGYREEEFTAGKPRWDQVLHPDDFGGYVEEVSEGLRSVPGFSARREYRIVRKDGEIRWLYEIIRNVSDSFGKPAYVEGTLIDITERKDMEKSLEGATEELARKNVELLKLDRMKDGLIRDVSHELKTPVAKHAMQLEILKPIVTEHGLSKEEIRAFAVMEESIRRQENVVRNLLDLSRLESGGRSYRRDPVHLDEIIGTIISDHQYAIDSYGIEIVSDVQPVTIQSDGEMLRHLLSNLFNNAIKYRNRNVPAMITVGIELRQDEIQIRIADNGIGIEEDDKQVLFERFYQASTASEGSGVGLAICKMISEGLGGRVWIESEGMGKGTTSFVALPLQ